MKGGRGDGLQVECGVAVQSDVASLGYLAGEPPEKELERQYLKRDEEKHLRRSVSDASDAVMMPPYEINKTYIVWMCRLALQHLGLEMKVSSTLVLTGATLPDKFVSLARRE